jgi:nitrogen fixation protein NifQ
MNRPTIYTHFWHPILQSYAEGETVLPPYLGLSVKAFQAIGEFCPDPQLLAATEHQHAQSTRQLRAELNQLRADEYQSLFTLLASHVDLTLPFALHMCTVLTYACFGTQHLWKDLGMPERPRLSQLFAYYFPKLYRSNDKNMRWKRFLYKQLCDIGGDYVCRSPSCEECSSYSECFHETP